MRLLYSIVRLDLHLPRSQSLKYECAFVDIHIHMGCEDRQLLSNANEFGQWIAASEF
jgi:hypothetical protein